MIQNKKKSMLFIMAFFSLCFFVFDKKENVNENVRIKSIEKTTENNFLVVYENDNFLIMRRQSLNKVK